MNLSTKQVINKAKAYAEENYDNGMDFFVECYESAEWTRFVGSKIWSDVKAAMDSLAANKLDHALDILDQ